MGILDGLPGGGGGDPLDLYGDLFSDKQKAALRQRELSQGLLSFAGKLGALSAPSRVPQGSFLGSLGQALGGFAPSDEAANKQLEAMKIAEQVKGLQQERQYATSVMPILQRLAKQYGLPLGDLVKAAGAPGAVPTAPGAPAANAPPPTGSPSGPVGSSTADYSSGFTGTPGAAPGGGDFPGATALPSPGQQQTSLLPPPPGSPDQVVGPDGQPLPRGVLPNMLASYGGAPGGMPPFRLASSGGGPTSGAGGDTPDLSAPAGVDLSKLMRIETLAKPAAASNLTGSNWEIANNNFGGMRRPGVNASPSQGGFQTFATPEAGIGAISRQLDRYASGATTGKPLSTIRQIVSTWAPPSENNTEALIARATKIMGVADNVPLNLSDPAVKAKLIEATVRNEQGGKLPVDPGLIAQVAQAPPGSYAAGGRDPVIPSGPRLQRSDLQNVADTGASAGAANPDGTIPGLGIKPEALAVLNAMMKLGGIKSDPFGSLLETYYKSPGYLGEAARTKTQAEKEVGLEYDPKIEAAKAAATQKYIQENETHKSSLDLARDLIGKGVYLNKETGRMEPITNADQALSAIDNAKEKYKSENEQVTATITLPGEARPREMPMTRAQFTTVSKGLAVPELGIPAMSGVKLGKPVYNPTETALGPVEAKAIFENQQLATDAATTIETNKEARRLLDSGVITGFGANQVTALSKLGNALKLTGKSTQETVANTEAYLATTAGNVGRMIKQFGAGTGLSDADREYAAQMAAGRVTLDETSIRRILDINDRASLNIINRHNQRVSGIAPGATLTPLTVPVPEPYKTPERAPAAGGNATKSTNEIIQNGWRYDATTHKPIGPVQ